MKKTILTLAAIFALSGAVYAAENNDFWTNIQKGFQTTIYVCILDAQIQQRDTR